MDLWGMEGKEMANPPRITDKERDRIRKLAAEGRTKADIARILGRNRTTISDLTCEEARRSGAPGARKRSAPHRKAARMRWAPKPPAELTDRDIADAFGPD